MTMRAIKHRTPVFLKVAMGEKVARRRQDWRLAGAKYTNSHLRGTNKGSFLLKSNFDQCLSKKKPWCTMHRGGQGPCWSPPSSATQASYVLRFFNSVRFVAMFTRYGAYIVRI
jgi:hypothetical protein